MGEFPIAGTETIRAGFDTSVGGQRRAKTARPPDRSCTTCRVGYTRLNQLVMLVE